MAEKISIQSITDLITSKAGRQYFTFEDMQQQRYVCFNTKLKDYCSVGSEIEVDLSPGKTPGDSPHLNMIYKNGKPVIDIEKRATGRSYGKSDKELLQQKHLEEAKRRSIESQTALNRAVDIAIATQDIKEIESHARIFYQLLQSLTLISETKAIYQEIKTRGKNEIAKAQIDKAPMPVNEAEADSEVLANEVGRESSPEDKMNKDDLYEAITKRIGWKSSAPVRSWIVNVMKIPEETQDSDPQWCWDEIRALKGWD